MPVRLMTCAVALYLIAMSAIGSSVGAWFTAATTTVKLRVTRWFCGKPLSTVTVMTATPLAFAAGANVSVPALSGLL